MVCRSTPGNSAVTSFARLLSGLDDQQMISLFHQSRREAPEGCVDPTRTAIDRFIDGMSRDVVRCQEGLSGPGVTPARAASLRGRLERARHQHVDGRTFYAWSTAVRTAEWASIAIDTQIGDIAARQGVPSSTVRAAFNRLAEHHRSMPASDAPPFPDRVSFDTSGLPQDRGTMFALTVLRHTPAETMADENTDLSQCGEVFAYAAFEEERAARERDVWEAEHCPDCGRFMPAGRADHDCPRETPEERQARDDALEELAEHLLGTTGEEDTTTPDTPSPAPANRPGYRTPYRNYRSGDANVHMMNLSQVRADARNLDVGESLTLHDVQVDFDGGASMSGPFTVVRAHARRSRHRDSLIVQANPLTGDPIVDGRDRAACEAIQALLNSRDPSTTPATAPPGVQQDVNTSLHARYDESVAAHTRASAEFAGTVTVSYRDSMEAFQDDYDAAKQYLADHGGNIPYTVGDNVFGRLGDPNQGGRTFGIEWEIDFPDDPHPYHAKRCAARELYEAGLSDYNRPLPWHFRNRGGGGYTRDPNKWVIEFDSSVDGLGGERGGEVVSPILTDTEETWRNMLKVKEILERNGAKCTPRTGLHVNVGVADFDHRLNIHNNLLGLSAAYEDTLIRMSHNPQAGPHHRGREYCYPSRIPADGFQSISTLRSRNDHHAMINMEHVPAEGQRVEDATRVELRMFDGSMDLGRIQSHVRTGLALVDAAAREVPVPEPARREPAGHHRSTRPGTGALTGEDWTSDTASTRTLFDALFARREDKAHAMHAFAATRWQRG